MQNVVFTLAGLKKYSSSHQSLSFTCRNCFPKWKKKRNTNNNNKEIPKANIKNPKNPLLIPSLQSSSIFMAWDNTEELVAHVFILQVEERNWCIHFSALTLQWNLQILDNQFWPGWCEWEFYQGKGVRTSWELCVKCKIIPIYWLLSAMVTGKAREGEWVVLTLKGYFPF